MRLEFLDVGEIVTTHGVRGEVKVLPWADGPDFLLNFKRILIDAQEYKVEQCRVQKSCNLLKIYGVNSIEDGQALRGKVIRVYREDAPRDLIFVAELEGMQVFADGTYIGDISEVLDYPGNKVYVVKGEHEYMIPAVKAYVLSTDVEKNRMDVRLIEGMRTDEN